MPFRKLWWLTYAGYYSGAATVTVTTGATGSEESSTQTFTSITSNSVGQASTVVSVVVITAAPDSPTTSATAAPTPSAVSKSSPHTSTIIGATIGVTAGAIVAGFICYVFYRRHKKQALYKNSTVFFPPDPPVYKPDERYSTKAELDTYTNSIAELPTNDGPGELDGSPSITSNPTCNTSPMPATSNDARWSAVSSLAPPRVHSPASAATVTPMAASLQAVSQQHYGDGQNYLLAPGATHRLYRPLSGTLPAIQVSGSENTLTSRCGSVASGEQVGIPRSGDKGEQLQEAQNIEGAHEVQREQSPQVSRKRKSV
jgi:hypothetical protein